MEEEVEGVSVVVGTVMREFGNAARGEVNGEVDDKHEEERNGEEMNGT